MFGSKGLARITMGRHVLELSGKDNWAYNGEKNDMYRTEHDELFASIRKGRPVIDGEWMANSTMMAMMGRDFAYTGQTITWEDEINSDKAEGPPHDTFSWDLQWEGPGVPVPGKGVWGRK